MLYVVSAKPAVSDFRGGLSIPGTNGPGGCGAFVKMPSVFVCLTAMCIVITNPESSAKMLSFNEVEGGTVSVEGGLLVSGMDSLGGPFIPNTNGPGDQWWWGGGGSLGARPSTEREGLVHFQSQTCSALSAKNGPIT